MGLRMHFPFSFITKRVDVSMGWQRCESHKLVMAAVAEMGPGQSLGRNYIKWWANGMPIRVFFGPGLFAKEIRPRARRFRNPTHVMNCGYGVHLLSVIAAVAAYSWLQSRHAAGDYAVASYAARGMSWLQLRRAGVGCSCGLLGLFRGSAGSVRARVSKLVPSVRGLRAANTTFDLPCLLQKS